MTSPQTNDNALNFSVNIQAMRGIAALMIVLGHCLTFASITLPNWLGGGVIHTFAYAGVDIFFVISGIVVSSAAQKSALRSTQKLPFKEFFYFAIKRSINVK